MKAKKRKKEIRISGELHCVTQRPSRDFRRFAFIGAIWCSSLERSLIQFIDLIKEAKKNNFSSWGSARSRSRRVFHSLLDLVHGTAVSSCKSQTTSSVHAIGTMKLDEIVAWYQKKIGTYDKQQWEKTVEQKILDGLSSVTLKTAKLKTELIDVDLVRGSTFPKAKPKQSLLTVIRLAILRYLFLPLYSQWWVRQTSPNIFGLLFFLYITQMISWAVYTFNVHHSAHNATVGSPVGGSSHLEDGFRGNATLLHNRSESAERHAEEHIVAMSELFIPMALSLLLSLIHSQIVATNTASGPKAKRTRFSNSGQNGKPAKESRMRRRKKLVKLRSQDPNDVSTSQLAPQRKPILLKGFSPSVDLVTKSKPQLTSAEMFSASSANPSVPPRSNQETFYTTSAILHNPCQHHHHHHHHQSAQNHALQSSDLNVAAHQIATDGAKCENEDCLSDNCGRKRNVNWHSPVHNCTNETEEKQQQTSPQNISTTTSSNASGTEHAGGAGVSTSSSAGSPTKTVRIDECVREFYDDLLSRTDATADVDEGIANRSSSLQSLRRPVGEDDGFESLNGKSSSGDEASSPNVVAAASTATTTTTAVAVAKNQLRLRLSTGDGQRSADPVQEKKPTTSFRRNFSLSSETLSQEGVKSISQPKLKQSGCVDASSDETEEEGDDGELISSPASQANNSNYNECTTSATEWLGVTTNSEECSYSSELDNSDDYKNNQMSDEDGYDLDFTPTTILNPHGTSDRISCTIWDQREIKKAQMSVLEISSCIIERVESMPEANDYIYIGVFFSFLLSLIPGFCRLCEATMDAEKSAEINYLDVPMLLWEKASFSFNTIFRLAFGETQWERTVLVIGFAQRLCLTMILFLIFAVAERTFKQRFLYAKLFSHLTSSRRARKSNLPHFRLNKVRNIKTWLSVRSYLKKRGPQRSVDVIVSAAFIVTLLLLAFLSVEWLKDSVRLHSQLNLEALMWSTTIGIFLLRFMTLGNKIHHKYRSVSVLITEQINLYLQIEQKPKKKDELMVSNCVLKLASDLLKELETPFKISGLSANPYLFTTIKVVILSALSGVLSEMLGFKLKLHKIKIK